MSDVMITVAAWLLVLVLIAYIIWNYFRLKKAANYVSNAEFQELIRAGGQLIDIRDPKLFQKKHILGARNFPMLPKEQFEASLPALRKNKPVLIYEGARGQAAGRAALILKKSGFTDIYVLSDGFDYWNGKVK